MVVVQNGTRFHEVTLGGSHIRFLWLGQSVSLPGVNAKMHFLTLPETGPQLKHAPIMGPRVAQI